MSSSAPFPTRYRRKFSRTKDGCLSCKTGRKKCDGHKPICGLCFRKRLECQWPDLNRDSEIGENRDIVVQRLQTESKEDQDGFKPTHQRGARDDVYCSGSEKAASNGNEIDDMMQLAGARSTKRCNETWDSSTPLSEANEDHLAGEPRYSPLFSSSPRSLSHPSMSSIVTIASPAANRMQLFNTYLTTHIPSNVLPQERQGSVYLMYFGFVEELARTLRGHPALIAAMNALSLVSVGSTVGDPEMLRKSSEEYSTSVNRLAAAVQRPDSVRDDGLLATIMVLATCEFYEPFAQKSLAKGYYSHILGLHSLLAARGPQPPQTRLTSLVLAKAKASSISKSMYSHQKDFHEAPGWRDLKLNIPSLDQDPSYDRGIRMSRLFARSYNLDLNSPHSLQEIDELLADGAELECDLRSDLDHHVASIWTSSSLPVTLEDIERFPRFCELVGNRTLSTAHRFPSYTIAYLYTSYWLRAANLRTVVKTLQAKRCLLSTADLPSFAHGFGKPVNESELRHYVICVCRNLPFFAESACASAGDICSIFPLTWASKYFVECKDAKWCAWLEDVRKHFFVRGVTFPALSRSRTLNTVYVNVK